MPSLANHESNDTVKALCIGDAKSGKTGSLVSLVKAGYKIRVLDMDNLLHPLKYFIQDQCPEKIDNVSFLTFRDKYKSSPSGPVIAGRPTAFVNALKSLDSWKDGDVDYGSPAEWGPDTILVIDSLSRLCDACYDFNFAIAASEGGKYDGRAVYYSSQKAIEDVIANLTSPNFATNIIVIAHVTYIDMPDGTKKGFPQSIGQALSPKIGQYFSTVVLFSNKGGKRTIQTNSTPLIDLANPAPFAMQPSYPIETGMADIFGVLREPPKANPKLKAV